MLVFLPQAPGKVIAKLSSHDCEPRTAIFGNQPAMMASTNTDPAEPIALRQSIEYPYPQNAPFPSSLDRRDNHKETMEMHELEQYRQDGDFNQDNCDDEHDQKNGVIKSLSTSKATSQTVTPYLTKHIPNQYAPLGPPSNSTALQSTKPKDPNSKYCYRHRPDRMCRRTADEETMEYLQRELDKHPEKDKEAVSLVWSLFSASPSRLQNLMYRGILAQCCFPELSKIAEVVRKLLKIDFVSALPSELSYKILSHLDTKSLCTAAQVSRKWRQMADDDEVWHRMCEQHVNRLCLKCGWGLPLLERQRLRDWKREQQLRALGRGRNEWSPAITPIPDQHSGTDATSASSLNGSSKRDATSFSSDGSSSTSPELAKRQCISSTRKTIPWKNVYKDRYQISSNWKGGRYSMKTFEGHDNGVMCLQFDDDHLATGSYDCTIKIWDIHTGQCIRTLGVRDDPNRHTSGVRALKFDNKMLMSGSLDTTLKIWNFKTGVCVKTLNHNDGVVALDFSGNTVVSGSIDGTVRVFNFQDGSSFILRGHTDWVNCVKLDVASRTVFSASDDSEVRLWDLDTQQCIRIFKGHVGQVQQLTLLPPEYQEPEEDEDVDDRDNPSRNSQSPDPQTPQSSPDDDPFSGWSSSRPRPPRNFITAGLDLTMRLWSVDTGRCLKKFFGHNEGVWAVAADNLRAVSGSQDKLVKIWDARTGKCERTLYHHTAPVTCIGLSDCRIASGSEDGDVHVLNFSNEDDGKVSPPPPPYH